MSFRTLRDGQSRVRPGVGRVTGARQLRRPQERDPLSIDAREDPPFADLPRDFPSQLRSDDVERPLNPLPTLDYVKVEGEAVDIADAKELIPPRLAHRDVMQDPLDGDVVLVRIGPQGDRVEGVGRFWWGGLTH
jgi:hypothetical protein